jgi:hypothetical protein
MPHPSPHPVDIVLAPEWWHRHAGISFDRDFFFHPARRVEEEPRMERIQCTRWGSYRLGSRDSRPELARDSSDPDRTGLCCINMNDAVTEAQVSAVFAAAHDLRQETVREGR